MKKFLIECPKCGMYHEGKNGFFARKIIECHCGHVIDIKKEKILVKECPHCGNSVLYDQTKGYENVCPVCHNNLNFDNDLKSFHDIHCPNCACELHISKKTTNYECPLCGEHIDVQEEVKKQEIKEKNAPSVIKYEGGNDTLVWKHPIEDFTLGSQLIVHESQEAIFFRDGKALDSFAAGRYTLATERLPLLKDLYKLPIDTAFHSKVYFINTVTKTEIKWGTDSKVRMFDPASGLSIELGAYGEFNIRVSNARKLLITLIGTSLENAYDIKTISNKFKAVIISKVKAILAKHIKHNNINILEVDEHLDVLSESMKNEINETLDEYGITMPQFFVLKVVTPDDDPNFRRLKEQYAEQYLLVRDEQIKKNVALAEQQRRVVEAQTGAQEELIAAQTEAEITRLKAQAKAEGYRMQAEAEAIEMQMKGYTYQDETRRQVSLSAMENMPQGGNSMGGQVSGIVGDMVGLGLTMGAVKNVMGMTNEIINPVANAVSQATDTSKTGWNCSCGNQNISTVFCPNCGNRKPEEKKGWDCACGQKNIVTNFCPNCGSKKPEENKGWDCACGQKNIATNFCPNCGNKKPEKTTWDCSCGQKDITTNFCPNCGNKKGE